MVEARGGNTPMGCFWLREAGFRRGDYEVAESGEFGALRQ